MNIKEVSAESLDLRYEKLRAKEPIQEKRLFASLGELGQQSPIVVVRADDIGRYLVIDGHKRVRALRKLKADTVKAAVWETPAPEALIHAYQIQAGSGYNPLEEGWLVEMLCRDCGWTLEEAARAFDRSRGWASRRLGLVESMPEIVLEGVQKGKIGSYAAMKYLLPLARANGKDAETLARAISEHNLTSRQVEIIYSHYTRGPKAVAQKILESPVLFLKAQGEARRGAEDPNLTPLQNRVLNNLKILGNISLGLARNLPEALGYDAIGQSRVQLDQAWQQAWERLRLLEKTGAALFANAPAQELTHAG